jgi:hypothetical protein
VYRRVQFVRDHPNGIFQRRKLRPGFRGAGM